MRSDYKILALAALTALLSPLCHGATVTGTVKGPDGMPFQGAFVQAQDAKTKVTVSVLSDKDGRYRVEDLPAGEFDVRIKATGYRSDPHAGVKLTSKQNASFDFVLASTPVKWNELSVYQAMKLLPAGTGKGKAVLQSRCFICHQFQTRMASVVRDEDGWKDRVQYMQDAMHFSLSWRLTDAEAADATTYLNSVFGKDSTVTRNPAELPDYQSTIRTFAPEAMKIVYVEYDMPGPNRMPFSAAPQDKNADVVWIPNLGTVNMITRLNTKTAEFQDYKAPNVGSASIHSAVAAPNGMVWFTEQGSNKLGKWDTATKKITEYQDPYLPGKEGIEPGGEKHTLTFDAGGNVWASGETLSRLDPETGKFTDYWDQVGATYQVTPDSEGNIWFTEPGKGIGKVDWKTQKITKWDVPNPRGFPRRLKVDSDGTVWIGMFSGGKITHFDPQTGVFKDYQLPGPQPTPYAIGIDADHNIWYSSYNMDVIGCLDPKTENVLEYPFPQSENSMREFFLDAQKRMWFGTPSNNKVGYFYLAGGTERSNK